MFLRNAWYVAALRDEIKDRPIARTILNEPIVLFRSRSGLVAALEDRCCHRGAPLSRGEITSDGIRCGYHGMEFNNQGVCIRIPGYGDQIPPRARVPSYPVVEKAGCIWIWMGAREAEPAAIVDYPPDDQAKWPRSLDMLHLKASYILVLENLMDLSHLTYLHKTSIGSSESDEENASVEVTKTSSGVRFLRVMRNATPPAAWVKRYGFRGNIDRWAEFEYVAPSIVLQYSGGVDAGAYDSGVREGGHESRVLHVVTPETETSCFYFFIVADGFAPDSTRAILVKDVFKEDAFMLEQQQLRLNGYDTDKLINIRSDGARVQMNRHLNEKIRNEQASVET